MRILSIPDQSTAPAAAPAAAPLNIPTLEEERVSALERVIDALQVKIHGLEERLLALESAPPRPAMAPGRVPLAPVTSVTWDAEDVKKNLLAKMWKYLQEDERPAKAV